MSKEFEKRLPFKVNTLIKEKGVATAKIVDAELDILECSFDNSDSVIIKTKGYKYITLTHENLKTLKKLIVDAEKYYDDYFDNLEK
jgi:UDP-N-acetyl-D-mannosaminuronate dehydrogenase